MNHELSFSRLLSFILVFLFNFFVSHSRISNRIMSHATLASKSTNQILSNLPAPLPPADCAAFKRCPICHPSLSHTLSLFVSLYLFLTQRVLILLEFSLDYVHMDSKTAAMCLCLVPTCCSFLVSCLSRLQSIIDLINYPRTVCVS